VINFAEPALKATNCIRAATQAAEARHFAEAIRMAWEAEAFAAEFARALERLRVEEQKPSGMPAKWSKLG